MLLKASCYPQNKFVGKENFSEFKYLWYVDTGMIKFLGSLQVPATAHWFYVNRPSQFILLTAHDIKVMHVHLYICCVIQVLMCAFIDTFCQACCRVLLRTQSTMITAVTEGEKRIAEKITSNLSVSRIQVEDISGKQFIMTTIPTFNQLHNFCSWQHYG